MALTYKELNQRAEEIGAEKDPAFKFLMHISTVFPTLAQGYDNSEYFLGVREAHKTGIPAPVNFATLPNVDGRIKIGKAISFTLHKGKLCRRETPVGLHSKECIENVAIFGAVGSGKTETTRGLTIQMLRGVAIDRERELETIAARRKDAVFLHYKDFRHNPFDVRHLPPELQEPALEKYTEDFSIRGGLYDASAGVLADIVITVFRSGRQRYGNDFVLSLRDLIICTEQRLNGKPSWQMRQYLERVLLRLKAAERDLGMVYGTGNSMLPYLKNRLLILSLDGPSG